MDAAGHKAEQQSWRRLAFNLECRQVPYYTVPSKRACQSNVAMMGERC